MFLLLTFTYSLTWKFVLWKQRVQKNLAVLNKRTKDGCSCLSMLLSVVGIVFLVVVIWILVKYLWCHIKLPNLWSLFLTCALKCHNRVSWFPLLLPQWHGICWGREKRCIIDIFKCLYIVCFSLVQYERFIAGMLMCLLPFHNS